MIKQEVINLQKHGLNSKRFFFTVIENTLWVYYEFEDKSEKTVYYKGLYMNITGKEFNINNYEQIEQKEFDVFKPKRLCTVTDYYGLPKISINLKVVKDFLGIESRNYHYDRTKNSNECR